MLWSILLPVALSLTQPTQHASSQSDGHRQGAVTIRPLAHFPNGTWVENLAVRSNGLLLLTLVHPGPHLYQFDPSDASASATPPQLVATFPGALGLFGIVEIEPDVFAVAKGNLSGSGPAPGSASLWKADFTKAGAGVAARPALSPLVDMPEAGVINGLTTASGGAPGGGGDWLLAADSLPAGAVWRVNWRTGEHAVALSDPSTRPTGSFAEGGFGANGVHVRGGVLHYTNLNKGYYTVPVTAEGVPVGTPYQVASLSGGDDFALDRAGNTVLVRNAVSEMDKITPAGEVLPLNFTNPDWKVLTEGSTSVRFGRTRKDANTAYVTTNGGMTGLVGPEIMGGLLLALDGYQA